MRYRMRPGKLQTRAAAAFMCSALRQTLASQTAAPNALQHTHPQTPGQPQASQPAPAGYLPLLLSTVDGFICSWRSLLLPPPLPLLPGSAAITLVTQSSWLRAQLMKAAA